MKKTHFYLKKRAELQEEATYLEEQEHALAEWKAQIESERQQATPKQNIPDWKKNLMAQKSEWEKNPVKSKQEPTQKNQEIKIGATLLNEAYQSIVDDNYSKFHHTFDQKSEVDILDTFYKGNTLLHWCVLYNRPKMALLLLGNGALLVPNKEGKTPVELVKVACEKDSSFFKLFCEIIKLNKHRSFYRSYLFRDILFQSMILFSS